MPDPASPAVLLDTCAAIWLANGDPMSERSRKAISESQAGPGVYVSPISAWEIGTLVSRNRLQLTLAPTRGSHDYWLFSGCGSHRCHRNC
jgi:PIN domain nuclease of toxin-antitoxin system